MYPYEEGEFSARFTIASAKSLYSKSGNESTVFILCCDIVVPQMSIIFDLPVVHQTDLVCEWLELADVARLDSALCCKKFRNDFLALIRCSQSIISGHVFQDGACVQWVVKRNVKIRCILLFANIVGDEIMCTDLLTNLSSPALECVTINTENGQNISAGVERVITILSESNPNLSSFIVESRTQCTTVQDQLLVTLLSRCTNLSTLELQNCHGTSGALLRALYSAPKLESIVLTGSLIQDKVYDIPLQLQNQNVTYFNCSNLVFLSGTNSLNISHICAHFPNLRSLFATGITNTALVTISQNCHFLESIAILVAETIHRESASEAAHHWPYLCKLSVHLTTDPEPFPGAQEDFFGECSCSEAALLGFIQHCPQLTYVNTVCRTHIYTQRFGEPGQDDVNNESGSHLRELYVDSLTAGGFDQVKSLCKRLELLAIHHEYLCEWDDEINEDAGSRPLETALHRISDSSVNILFIHNFGELSGEYISSLANLREIRFVNAVSRKLSDRDVLSLVSRCPDLQVLNITNCFLVSGNFVLSLLSRCPALTSLTLLNGRIVFDFVEETPFVRMLRELVRGKHSHLQVLDIDCKSFG